MESYLLRYLQLDQDYVSLLSWSGWLAFLKNFLHRDLRYSKIRDVIRPLKTGISLKWCLPPAALKQLWRYKEMNSMNTHEKQNKEFSNKVRESDLFGTRPRSIGLTPQEGTPCALLSRRKENSMVHQDRRRTLHLLHHLMLHWWRHRCYHQPERQQLVIHWDHGMFLWHPDGDFSSYRPLSLSTSREGNSSENTWARLRLWATSIVVSINKALWAREKIEIEALKTRARVFHAVHLFHMLASRQWT